MQKSYDEKGRENSYSAAISCRWVFLFMKVRRSQTIYKPGSGSMELSSRCEKLISSLVWPERDASHYCREA